MQTRFIAGNVVIRPWQSSDEEEFYCAIRESVTELEPWLPWAHGKYKRQDTRTWLASRTMEWDSGSKYSFAIEDAQSHQLLGGCGLNRIDREHLIANLGYWVRSTCCRRGIATSAVKLLSQFAFRQLNLARIEIVIIPTNIASRRVAEKSGAQFEGLQRNRLSLRGSSFDAAMYSLTPHDLAQGKQPAAAAGE